MITLWSFIAGGELYVFYGSALIYKRWITRGYGRMFYEGAA